MADNNRCLLVKHKDYINFNDHWLWNILNRLETKYEKFKKNAFWLFQMIIWTIIQEFFRL